MQIALLETTKMWIAHLVNTHRPKCLREQNSRFNLPRSYLVRSTSQFLPQLLHAPVQIHAHRTMLEACARGDLRSGHALYQPQQQNLTVGLRQAANDGQEKASLIVEAASRFALCLLTRQLLRQLDLFHGVAMVVMRAIAGDCRQPRTKAGDIAKRVQAG